MHGHGSLLGMEDNAEEKVSPRRNSRRILVRSAKHMPWDARDLVAAWFLQPYLTVKRGYRSATLYVQASPFPPRFILASCFGTRRFHACSPSAPAPISCSSSSSMDEENKGDCVVIQAIARPPRPLFTTVTFITSTSAF